MARMSDTPFPYRLAASDLDGTLLGPDKEISEANRAAVSELQARGARFVVASGRRHQNSLRYYRTLGLDGLMISCAGALVKDPDTGETLREVLLPAPQANALVASGQERGYTVIYYHRDHLYIDARNRWTDLYESRVGEKAELYPGGDLRGLKGEAALKIVWYGDPAALKPERERVADQYHEQLQVISTDSENLEFSAPAANKAEALAAVAAYYEVTKPDTLAFGDGENDAPMLRWAGLGVAMDGSNPLALEAAALIGPAGSKEERFSRAVQAVLTKVRETATIHG